jgi:hypothetical protein
MQTSGTFNSTESTRSNDDHHTLKKQQQGQMKLENSMQTWSPHTNKQKGTRLKRASKPIWGSNVCTRTRTELECSPRCMCQSSMGAISRMSAHTRMRVDPKLAPERFRGQTVRTVAGNTCPGRSWTSASTAPIDRTSLHSSKCVVNYHLLHRILRAPCCSLHHPA